VGNKKFPTKTERTSIHCIRTIQCSTCLRQIFATYLHDDAPEGKLTAFFACALSQCIQLSTS
jgi:hypothetical protein